MTIRGTVDVPFFLIGGYDLRGTLTDINMDWSAITEETHTLGDSWIENSYVGVRQANIQQSGFYDDDAGSAHEALSTGPGISRVLCFGLEGTATGAHFIGFNGAMEVNYRRIANRGVLHKAEAVYRGNGQVDEGRIIRTLKVATASGTSSGTPVDNGASSTGFAVGYLQSQRVDAIGNVVAKLQHSSDNVTFADLLTFAAVTSAAPSGQRVVSAATAAERYVIGDWVFATAAVGASWTFFLGLARP